VEKVAPANDWNWGKQMAFSSRRGGPGKVYLVDLGWMGDSLIARMRGSIGETLELDVTGSADGMIWGSGVYTDDSPVETAAVHAGLLKPGETGRIRVTILPGRPSYQASFQNGVRSESFESYDGSYRLERIK
jgi:hypothetical protein